jgi:L-ascorbate metabolism protein UlaG (beta-lactamase superfamily)
MVRRADGQDASSAEDDAYRHGIAKIPIALMTRLTWLGHSTVLLETGGLRLLTDPVLRARIGPIGRRLDLVEIDLDAVDAVLISHLHHDHLDLPSMRLLRPDIPVIVPSGAGRLMRSSGFPEVTELDVGESTNLADTTIEAVPARHGGRRLPFGPTAPALGFRIDGEHAIYFAGDTDVYPEMARLAPGLDLAILPVGGWGPTLRGGHMDAVRAALALTLLRPRTAVAIHWGTLWPFGMGRVRRDRFEEPGRRFVAEAGRVAPSVSVPLLAAGDRLDLPVKGQS